MTHRTPNKPAMLRSRYGFSLLAAVACAPALACSSSPSTSSSSSTPASSADDNATTVQASEMVGTYQGAPGAQIAWFNFLSDSTYELQPASCAASGPPCYASGTYTIGEGNTLELSDDGTGKPGSIPLGDVQAGGSTGLVGSSESPGDLKAQGVGLVSGTQAALVQQVSSFSANGSGYQLVSGGGTTCTGVCKPTVTLIAPYSGLPRDGAIGCSRTSWGSCGLGMGCCHD